MADESSQDVLVQVCIECGTEYFYVDEDPPTDLRCEKCGNEVFRSFYTETQPDEVARDYAEATERDVATEDGATDVTRGDLHDLNNL